MIHEETDEAIQQVRDAEIDLAEDASVLSAGSGAQNSVSQSRQSVAVSGSASKTGSVAAASQIDVQKKSLKKEKLVKNQFNFSDRGAQSGKIVFRVFNFF